MSKEHDEELDKAIAEDEAIVEVEEEDIETCALCGERLIDCECSESLDDDDEEEDNEEEEKEDE